MSEGGGVRPEDLRLLPGRRLPALAVAGLGPALLAAFVPEAWWVWAAGLAAVAAAVVVDLRRLPHASRLLPFREAPTHLDLGVTSLVAVRVESRADAPVHLTLADGAPHAPLAAGVEPGGTATLPAGEQAQFTYPLLARDRGLYSFQPLALRWETSLGLVARQARWPLPHRVKVYPDLRPLRSADALKLPLLLRELGLKPAARRGGGTEFDSLREHGPDDGQSAVDWKATARRQRPVVRTYRDEQNHDLVIAVDCGRLMGTRHGGVTKLDHALSGALVLARTSLLHGDRPGLLAFHQRVVAFVRPDKGPAQLPRLVEGTYALQTDWSESSLRRALLFLDQNHRKRSFVVFLTDFVHGEADPHLVETVLRIARRHLTLFVAIRDPHLERIPNSEPVDSADPYRQAVVARLLEDRRMVLHTLQQRGVAALDVDPSAIAAPVINAYLALRGQV